MLPLFVFLWLQVRDYLRAGWMGLVKHWTGEYIVPLLLSDTLGTK